MFYLGKQNWSIRSVSEKAVLSHDAGRHFTLNFTIKQGISSVMVMGRGLFLSSFGGIHVRHEGFSFYDHRKSNNGADRSDIIFAGLIILTLQDSCSRILHHR